MNSGPLKRTPLFSAHQALGGRLIEFGGWEMPVQYTSITEEHLAVRNAAGIFDISHMGEISLRGPGALVFLNRVLVNDARKLAVGQGQYSLMCNERGGVIDDLYVYRLEEAGYLLIVNASRIEADYGWLEERRRADAGGFVMENESDRTGAVAVQGPRVAEFINQCFGRGSSAGAPAEHPTDLKKNQIARFRFARGEGWVSRTGYTGEDGFEIVAPAETIGEIWNVCLDAGRTHGLVPAGLGARDTLRTEVCYPLYGHELDEQTTPIEAGLSFFVALDKGEFAGRGVLAEQRSKGVTKKLAAFKMTGKSPPPRPRYSIWSTGPTPGKLGEVTSGTQSPSLGIGIGMGYLPPEAAKAQTAIEIEIRGKRAAAIIVPKPIFRKPG